MLDFIPYIPPNTKGVESVIWQTALQAWTFNLSQLLDMHDELFLKETTSNTSLAQFVEQVLNEQIDDMATVDSTLIKGIFFIYLRLSKLERDTSFTHPLLTIGRICSFAIVYGDSNTNEVRSIISELVKKDGRIEQQLASLLSSLSEGVQSIPSSLKPPVSIDLLDQAYMLVRTFDALLSATLLVDSIYSTLNTLDAIIIQCYDMLIPILEASVQDDPDAAPHAYLIKKTLVSCFNTYVDMYFFQPLGLVSSLSDHHQLTIVSEEKGQSNTIIELMCEKIIKYIEESGLESTRSAFVDGPLIMDWETEYHIVEKLGWINNTLFGNDDARIEFLKLSMEQVRDSNKGTGTWGELLNQPIDIPEVDLDIEITSKISQVHDLFPDYGEGFIEACLKASDNNVEQVIMQLLENNLPSAVSQLDRSMERTHLPSSNAAVAQMEHLESESLELQEEREDVLKSRHNIYDNDEFDIFNRKSVDASKVYAGKKNKANADDLLDDKSFIQNEKSKVFQRVIDMYDDEYDDTYDDINDAGIPSTVDNGDGDSALDIVKKKQQENDPGSQNESLLVHTLVENPDLFGRKGSIRKSTKRAELRKRTGMSDEQLEGWAIMFNRNVSVGLLALPSFSLIHVLTIASKAKNSR